MPSKKTIVLRDVAQFSLSKPKRDWKAGCCVGRKEWQHLPTRNSKKQPSRQERGGEESGGVGEGLGADN